MKLKTAKAGFVFFFLFLLVIIFSLPVVWMLMQSLKTPVDAIAIPPKILFRPTFENYLVTLKDPNFIRSLVNSLVVAGASVMLVLFAGVPAAYALARFKFIGADSFGFSIFSTIILPLIAVLVPFVKMFQIINLTGTILGVIIAHLMLNLGIVVWVMRSFFMGIPRALEDAARVDGCTLWQVFWRIALPGASSGLATVTVLSFIFSWNDLLFALVLTPSTNTTLPVYLVTAHISYFKVDWGGLSATGVLMIIPAIALLFSIRNHLARAFSLGSVGK